MSDKCKIRLRFLPARNFRRPPFREDQDVYDRQTAYEADEEYGGRHGEFVAEPESLRRERRNE